MQETLGWSVEKIKRGPTVSAPALVVWRREDPTVSAVALLLCVDVPEKHTSFPSFPGAPAKPTAGSKAAARPEFAHPLSFSHARSPSVCPSICVLTIFPLARYTPRVPSGVSKGKGVLSQPEENACMILSLVAFLFLTLLSLVDQFIETRFNLPCIFTRGRIATPRNPLGTLA